MIGSLLKLLGIYSSNSSVSKVPKLNTKVEENSNAFNITDRLSNQADDIKLWDIKSEHTPYSKVRFHSGCSELNCSHIV